MDQLVGSPRPRRIPGGGRSALRRALRGAASLGILAGALVVPGALAPEVAHGAATPITCSNGTSPFSLTYNTTGLTTPSITLPLTQVGAPGVIVDWGDGTTSPYTTGGNQAHTFPAAGTYTVQICGTLQTFGAGSAVPNVSTLVSVNSFGTLGTLDSLAGAFFGATNLVSVPNTLPASVTKIPQMFQGATSFNDANVSNWDTSRIINMTSTFSGATSFNRNLSAWSQAANQSVVSMFQGATKFNNGCAAGAYSCPLTWTTPNLTVAYSAFQDAQAFNQSLSTWNTSKIVSIYSMFRSSGFNNGCADGVTSCPLTWTLPVATTLTSMFYSAPIFNQNVTTFLSGPNNVVNLQGMFREALKFNNGTNEPALNTWKTSKVTTFSQMFMGVPTSSSAFNRHIEGWDLSAATDLSGMFRSATGFNNGCIKGDRTCPLSWSTTSKVTTINSMFFAGTSTAAAQMSFDQNINAWDISSITEFGSAFGWNVFNNAGEPFWSGKTVKTGAVMNRMFSVNANFNVPVGGLNVSGAKIMSGMFAGTKGFDQDISNWRVSGLTTQPCCSVADHSMQNFFESFDFVKNGISVANYEKWLYSLTTDGGDTTYVPTGTIMNMGNSKYTCNAKPVRDKLALRFTLTDGGMVALPPPTITAITPGDRFLDVSFSAPKCLGVAQAPSSYYYSKDNGVTWLPFAAPSPDATADGTLRISNLTNSVSYPIRLRAFLTGVGDGAPSAPEVGTPGGPVTLEPIVTVADKTYDGTTRATITGCQLKVKDSSPAQSVTDPSIASCDVAAATATFANSYARPATPWSVSVTGVTLTGPRAADYQLDAAPAATATINPAPLAVVPADVEVAAGTGAGAITYPFVLSGWVNGESAVDYTITSPVCSAPTYSDTQSASDPGATISCTGGTVVNKLPSSSFSNYVFDRTATSLLTVASGPPPVRVQATITVSDKVYDGNRTASIVGCVISGADAQDTLSCDLAGATTQFDTKNVGGSKSVTATGIALSVGTNNSGSTYVLDGASWSATAAITPKPVTPAVTVADKMYDRTTTAVILTCTLSGVIASEASAVTCDKSGATATFANANAAPGKAVTAVGLVLAGNTDGNYSATTDSADATAEITKAPATLKAVSDTKVYDGTTVSGRVPLAGLLGGESTNATQSFSAADAGPRTLTVDVGCGAVTITDAGTLVTNNYAITCDATTASGAITPAPVMITPATDTKPYDSTVASAREPSISGLVGLDDIDATQRFDSAVAGDRTLEIASHNFVRGNPANYSIDDFGTFAGSIDPIGPIRVKAPSVQYAFNGSTPILTPTITGLLPGDTLASPPVCRVYATTDLSFAAPITNFGTITPGNYSIHCSGAQTGPNYDEIIYADGVLQPEGRAAFTGNGITFTTTNSASVTLSATVDPGTAGCYALFTLYDIGDNEAYKFGPFNAATGAVATNQIIAVGHYTVLVTAFGNCYGLSDGSDMVSVVHDSVGRGSVGGGFYRNGAAPSKINFGYEVQTTSSTKGSVTTTTTKGQLLWIAKIGWRVKASINYSSTNGTTKWTRIACPSNPTVWPSITKPMCGQIQGAGKLQRMNPSTFEWETYDANIAFTATVYDGGQVTTCKSKSSCTTTQYPDFFGMVIWASDGSQILPGSVSPSIPTSEPIRLANGQTRVFSG